MAKMAPKNADNNSGINHHKSLGHNDVPKASSARKGAASTPTNASALPKAKPRDKETKGGPSRDKGNDGNGGNRGNNRYGAYAGYKGVKRKRAARLVDADLKDVMLMLRRELRRGRRQTRNELGDVRQEFRNERKDINHVFDETGQFIGQQNDIIDERFGAASAQAQAAQAALMQQLGGINAATAGGVNSELGRLGLGANGGFTDQLSADQAYATDIASIMGANNQANLGAMETSAGAIGSLLASTNEGSRGSMLSANMRNRDEQVKDIRQNQRDFGREIRQQVIDMKSQRGDMIRQMLEQLSQTGWAQYVDQQSLNQSQQQINMQRQQMQHAMAMDRSGISGGSGSSGSSSTNDVIANWLNGGGENPNGGGQPSQPKKPKKPQYSIWHPQLGGNYYGDPEDYLP